MEKIASYEDRNFLREHPVVMEKMILSNASTSLQKLESGSVIGIADGGAKTFFAHEMTSAIGILAEAVELPAKSETAPGTEIAAVYVHGDFIARFLKFASDVDENDKSAAFASLRNVGCYAY